MLVQTLVNLFGQERLEIMHGKKIVGFWVLGFENVCKVFKGL